MKTKIPETIPDYCWDTSGIVAFQQWRDTKRPVVDYTKLHLMQDGFKAGRLSILKEQKEQQ